ncbi:MAG TPA: DNA-processing protein DprA, partial [Acidimicrobiales bacterium]|nr:DNA-processing protein DprA [Acidimicrobiales bacterium]
MTPVRIPIPGPDGLPEEAYAVALSTLPGVGPRTLRALLEETTPRAAWEALVEGTTRLPAFRRPASGSASAPSRVRGQARTVDVAAVWAAHVDAGVDVCTLGEPGYPAALADDPEAPAVLFSVGTPRVLDAAPRVAIVGTRSATRYGLGVAAQLG